jgi:hypothetical protein
VTSRKFQGRGRVDWQTSREFLLTCDDDLLARLDAIWALAISERPRVRARMIGLRTDEVDRYRAIVREAENDDRMMLNKQRNKDLDEEGLGAFRVGRGG